MAMITVRGVMKKRMAFLHGRIFRCDVVGFVKSYSMEQLEDEYDKQQQKLLTNDGLSKEKKQFLWTKY